jgi:hypothetical protein
MHITCHFTGRRQAVPVTGALAEIDVNGDCLHGYIRKIGEVIVQGYD